MRKTLLVIIEVIIAIIIVGFLFSQVKNILI